MEQTQLPIHDAILKDLDFIKEKVEELYQIDLKSKRRYNPIPEARFMFCMLVDEIYPLSANSKGYFDHAGRKTVSQETVGKYLGLSDRSLISYYMKKGFELLEIDKRFRSRHQMLRIPTFAGIMKHLQFKEEYRKHLIAELKKVSSEIKALKDEKNKRFGYNDEAQTEGLPAT